MKKEKMLLIVIGLLSAVGGALAHKAHRVTGGYFCYTKSTEAGFCTIRATAITPNGATVYYCTTVPNKRCTKTLRVDVIL